MQANSVWRNFYSVALLTVCFANSVTLNNFNIGPPMQALMYLTERYHGTTDHCYFQ